MSELSLDASPDWARATTGRAQSSLSLFVRRGRTKRTSGTGRRRASRDGDGDTADDDHELPAFSGPRGSEKEVLARFTELRSLFAPVQLAPMALSLSDRYAWTVKLDNGMSVALGREQDKDTLKRKLP